MLRIRLYFEPNIIKAQVRYFAVNLEQTTRKRSKYTTGVAYKVQRPLSFFPANAWIHVKRSLLKRGRMRARCLGKMRQTHYHANQSGVTLKIERTLLLITVRIPEFPCLLIHSSFVYEAIFRINPNFRSFRILETLSPSRKTSTYNCLITRTPLTDSFAAQHWILIQYGTSMFTRMGLTMLTDVVFLINRRFLNLFPFFPWKFLYSSSEYNH